LLTVIYDLLIEAEDNAQILDWKTYPQPKEQNRLAKDWQTRLYLYVLAETSDYLPEQISMDLLVC
jgi:ATP-dependent exoDNAse (exonuclease V) beta subunit